MPELDPRFAMLTTMPLLASGPHESSYRVHMIALAPDRFMRDPVGGYVAGRSFVVWVQTPSRLGACHRSPLDQSETSTLLSLVPLLSHPRLEAPIDMLHDLGAVSVVERSAFAWAETFVAQYIEAIAARTRRLAVVRPTGLAGAAFTGIFHDFVRPRMDARLFAHRAEAHAWLDVGDADRNEIDDLHDSLAHPSLVRKLREHLAGDLAAPTIGHMAKALGVSTRSLQRHIAGVGSTFSRELASARMRAAETLLLDGDDKVETIAKRVGFRSAAAFATRFQFVNGETPSAFRARKRG